MERKPSCLANPKVAGAIVMVPALFLIIVFFVVPGWVVVQRLAASAGPPASAPAPAALSHSTSALAPTPYVGPQATAYLDARARYAAHPGPRNIVIWNSASAGREGPSLLRNGHWRFYPTAKMIACRVAKGTRVTFLDLSFSAPSRVSVLEGPRKGCTGYVSFYYTEGGPFDPPGTARLQPQGNEDLDPPVPVRATHSERFRAKHPSREVLTAASVVGFDNEAHVIEAENYLNRHPSATTFPPRILRTIVCVLPPRTRVWFTPLESVDHPGTVSSRFGAVTTRGCVAIADLGAALP